MKRPSKAQNENFEGFLKEFTLTVNEGVHNDLERACGYLTEHGLDNYIEDRDGEEGCNLSAIEANEELTVEDVFQLGVHWALYGVHSNWHDAMKDAAKNNGVDLDDYTEEDAPRIETFGAEVPAEVIEAITELSKALTTKKPAKKAAPKKPRGKK